MRKICVVTTSRAEYGLLFWLLKGMQEDSDLKLQLLVTGTHLSAEFGSTIDQIRDDGFHVDRSFSLELKDDSPTGISHSLAIAIEEFATAFATLKPDILVLLGDRFELLGAASSALIANIPIAHIHGGELTLGAIDDAVRHAVTKMSRWHFTATESYRKRVIQMGEMPANVYNVGGMGLDNIKKLKLLNRKELEKELDFKFGEQTFLATYHPETLDPQEGLKHFNELLKAINELKNTTVIFTLPNADTGHKNMITALQDYVLHNATKCKLFSSLGQLRYLSLMKQVDAVIGNSSSGIIEAPAFKVPTINIGDRQLGRTSADSVIHCTPVKSEILSAFNKINTPSFKKKLSQTKNPYGTGGAALKILKELKSFELKPEHKNFHDL